jgi:nitrile hydratase
MARAIHDMGGNERFYGSIEREIDEPVFHEPWEARTFGMAIELGATLGQNFDAFRDAIERLEPELYLRGYYVRWLGALEQQIEGRGFVAPGELDARLSGQKPPSTRTRKVMQPMPWWLLRVYPRARGFARKVRRARSFQVGDVVRAVAERPSGHTRIPGYLCGREGTVQRAHGAMVCPDSHARRQGEDPQHLYTVAFEGAEVWGPSSEPGVLLLVDLFEPYLEAA